MRKRTFDRMIQSELSLTDVIRTTAYNVNVILKPKFVNDYTNM